MAYFGTFRSSLPEILANLSAESPFDPFALAWIVAGGAIAAAVLLLNRQARLRRRIESQRAMIAEQRDALAELLYAASHDVRTPLLAVLGFAKEVKLLCDETRGLIAERASGGGGPASHDRLHELIEQEMPEAADYIQQEALQMERLLMGLLQLSRLYRMELAPRSLDFAALALEAAEELGQPSDVVTSEGLPSCFGDADRVRRLIRELLDNAVRHGGASPSQPVRITAERQSDGMIAYTLHDRGPGIAPDAVPRALALFGQVDPRTTPGQGLGLPTAQWVALRHGGRIAVVPEVGQGLAVRVVLPGDEVTFYDLTGSGRPEAPNTAART